MSGGGVSAESDEVASVPVAVAQQVLHAAAEDVLAVARLRVMFDPGGAYAPCDDCPAHEGSAYTHAECEVAHAVLEVLAGLAPHHGDDVVLRPGQTIAES